MDGLTVQDHQCSPNMLLTCASILGIVLFSRECQHQPLWAIPCHQQVLLIKSGWPCSCRSTELKQISMHIYVIRPTLLAVGWLCFGKSGHSWELAYWLSFLPGHQPRRPLYSLVVHILCGGQSFTLRRSFWRFSCACMMFVHFIIPVACVLTVEHEHRKLPPYSRAPVCWVFVELLYKKASVAYRN